MQRAIAADRARFRAGQGPGPRTLASQAKPEGIDLDALYIQMTPSYHQYCLDYTIDGLPRLCPGTENDQRWPDRGEVVTFTAHYMNKGTIASGPLQYAWAIDGVEVARGSFPNLLPGTGTVAVYRWPWDHDAVNGRLLGRHTVRFTLDPDNKVAETYKENNTLEDRTDATPLGFQTTPEVYQALETPVDPKWPFSAEDWAQKQFHAMNDAFARSVYPSAPNGCEERVRLDQFRVTPGPVANDGGIGGHFYGWDDRSPGGYYDVATDVSGGMIHELGHQLGIIDVYTLNFSIGMPLRVLDQNGRPALMEQNPSYLSGLMVDPGIQPPRFDEDTVGGMNRNKGYRRGYFGEYLWDMPSQTRVRILDNRGNPATGVTLRLFRVAQYIGYGGVNDNIPEISVTTDSAGVVNLPNRPAGAVFATATGHTLADNPFGAVDLGGDDMFLVEIGKGRHQEYAWLDVSNLNLLTWQGGSTLELHSHVPPPDAPLPPSFLTGTEEQNGVALNWGASPTAGVRGYKVYRTSGPRDEWNAVTDIVTGLNGTFDVERDAIGFAVTAVDSTGRESGFSDIYWAMRLQSADGIAIDAANRRFLRQWNSVILQGADGRYLNMARAGEPDQGHLVFDPNGRLLMCRRDTGSVGVIDPGGDPRYNLLFDLAAPAAVEPMRPTGIAVRGAALTWGGPYGTDEHTALLCHFDGTLNAEGGARANATNVTLVPGRFGQGVDLGVLATLSYPLPSLSDPDRGAIEFWLQPSWDGNDAKGHVFLAAGTLGADGVLSEKDGANNLRFLVWSGGTERGVGYSVNDWKRGDWHHVAVTWLGSNLEMFVDGRPVGSVGDCRFPSSLGSRLFVGGTMDGNEQPNGRTQADAILDELRVSDIPRVGNSDTTAYRIVVADSGNDRLQVFDALGGFVSSFGTTGSGHGEFTGPRGLAIDDRGRVVVVDSGNQRLQLLAFDGTNFTFIREIRSGLLNADGVAIRGDRIVVADTGHDQVKVMSDTGTLIATYDGPNDGVYFGNFLQPHAVAIDNNGRIVVTDTGNNRIVEVIHTEGRLPRRRIDRDH